MSGQIIDMKPYNGREKKMKYAVQAFLLLCLCFSFSSARAKVPDSLLKQKEKQKYDDVFGKTKKQLLKKGYKRNVFGLDLGYIAPEFALERGKSIYIAPIKNLTRMDDSAVVDSLKEIIRNKVAGLFEETRLFEAVYSEEKPESVDLVAVVYVRDIYTFFGYLSEGSECTWGVDVYDNNGEIVLSGFDRITSDSYSRDVDFLMGEVPALALLFVCRNNSDFNREFNKLLRDKKLKPIRN